MNLTEATEVTGTDQQAETDHLLGTDIQIQAAAADTNQAAETETQETEHLLITSHQETHISTDQNQEQVIIQEAPETDPYQETDTLTDHVGPTPETGTIIEGNAAEHQTAKAQEGRNRPCVACIRLFCIGPCQVPQRRRSRVLYPDHAEGAWMPSVPYAPFLRSR